MAWDSMASATKGILTRIRLLAVGEDKKVVAFRPRSKSVALPNALNFGGTLI